MTIFISTSPERFLLLFLITILLSCNSKSFIYNNKDKEVIIPSKKYEILKIDSVNSFYIVYLKKDNKKYKVVSKKEVIKECDFIHVGSEYEFNLSSIRSEKYKFGNKTISSSLVVNCFYFDKQTKICIEESEGIYDLFWTNQLKGLCYIDF